MKRYDKENLFENIEVLNQEPDNLNIKFNLNKGRWFNTVYGLYQSKYITVTKSKFTPIREADIFVALSDRANRDVGNIFLSEIDDFDFKRQVVDEVKRNIGVRIKVSAFIG